MHRGLLFEMSVIVFLRFGKTTTKFWNFFPAQTQRCVNFRFKILENLFEAKHCLEIRYALRRVRKNYWAALPFIDCVTDCVKILNN